MARIQLSFIREIRVSLVAIRGFVYDVDLATLLSERIA
jgi:hypothetical protein